MYKYLSGPAEFRKIINTINPTESLNDEIRKYIFKKNRFTAHRGLWV